MPTKTFLFFALLNLSVLSGEGAEVKLLSHCSCAGSVVRLGDVAEISGLPVTVASPEQAVLFPSPSPGQCRELAVSELRELLELKGVELKGWRFTGAQVVKITAGEPAGTASAKKKLTPFAIQAANQRAEQVVLKFLRENVDPAAQWTVKLDLADEAGKLPAKASEITVQGGEKPWVGAQRFELLFASPRGIVKLPITVEVSLPDVVVVAKRPLRRGEMLSVADVELKAVPLRDREIKAVFEVDEVVGKELGKSVATGQPLDARSVQMPVVVKRNELITIVSRAPGVRVKTNAKSLDQGGLGDLITVESLENRKRFTARVTGLQEAEIWASGTKVSDGERN